MMRNIMASSSFGREPCCFMGVVNPTCSSPWPNSVARSIRPIEQHARQSSSACRCDVDGSERVTERLVEIFHTRGIASHVNVSSLTIGRLGMIILPEPRAIKSDGRDSQPSIACRRRDRIVIQFCCEAPVCCWRECDHGDVRCALLLGVKQKTFARAEHTWQKAWAVKCWRRPNRSRRLSLPKSPCWWRSWCSAWSRSFVPIRKPLLPRKEYRGAQADATAAPH